MSTAGTIDLPLEVFSGMVSEIAPSDLPAGASPKCQDVQFPLGCWRTRPGLGGGVFAALAGNPTINYQKTFVDQARNKRFLFLDATGSINQEFPQGALTLGINSIPIPAGSYAKSATAYGKEYIAVSDGQFGTSDPAQFDGTFYDRLSQVGPGAPPTAVDSAAAGNSPAGVHLVSVFFITRAGFWTKPAPPFTWTAAGNKKVSLTNIPVGPPNVIARVVCFTTAGGAVFFFTTNASNILTSGNMVINDNVTTTLTVDFSDVILGNGSNVQYLLSLLELEECAGVVSYATRLFTWGGRNLVPNFINLPFDGGFGGTPTSTSAGPNSPTASITQPPVPWANPNNIFALDGALASVSLAAGASSGFIEGNGYGFPIPANATILGIVVLAYVSASVNNKITDQFVRIVKGGFTAGTNHANGNAWTNAVAPQTYGSSSDLWGTTWTPSDINSATFGAEISALNSDSVGQTANCDYIGIQVFYTQPGAGAVPLGWTAGTFVAGGNSALAGAFSVAFGDAYSITGDGATAVRGQILQSAFQDYLNNVILKTKTSYTVRARVASAGVLTQGTFHINLQSTTGAFTTSGLSVQAAQTTAKYQVFSAILTSALGVIPADLLLQVYADGTPNNNGVFLVDSIQIFPTNTPYLTSTMRGSYAGQPESFDQLTGVLQPFFQDGGTIRNAFVLREKLYILKDNAWYVTQDDGANEPSSWTITSVSNAIGACGINALDVGEDWGIAANRAGPYVFWGAEPVKVGQEIQSDSSNSGKPTWNSINWAFGYTIWVLVDRVNKRALIGAPINGATSPNIIFYFDFVGMDTAQEVADHWSVKYSPYTGKILAIGNAPKWCPAWNISSNSAALIERTDGTAHTFIGNGAAPTLTGIGPSNTGKIYDLLDANKSDDGAGIPWSYSTYFTPSHMEEQALQIKSHRKLYVYLAGYVKGSGAMGISPQPMGNITPVPNQNFQLVDPNVSNAITGISRVNGVTTVTCAAGHGLTNGIDVQAIVQNSADASFNGTVPIQQILNPMQFTFSQYLMPDLILGAAGTVTRLSREFEFTTNILAERCSFTFSNAGNAAGSWAQCEKIVFSIVPDPWSPVRGNVY
jgi:hypothetical protein